MSTTSNQQRILIEAALRYARRYGWKLFPLSGKKPSKGSHGFKDASANSSQIKRLFANPNATGIGARCDSARGPLVLDVDGPKGDKAVRKFALPPTLTAQSRPGRYHLYFSPPTDGALAIPRKIGFRPQLDLLGDGGYVILPPSIHPKTGKTYRWHDRDTLLEPFPPELLDVLAKERKLNGGAAPPLPDKLYVGQRDEFLTSLAGSMRRRGMSEKRIFEALSGENSDRCVPLLPEKQVRKIAHSIAQKPPARVTGALTTDTKADVFIRLFGDRALYVDAEGRGRWLIWDGVQWRRDRRRNIEHLVREVTKELEWAYQNEQNEEIKTALVKFANQSASQHERDGLLRNLRSRPELAREPETFDRAPYLLTVANGTLDLQTGKRRSHRRDDYITRAVPIRHNRKATCPTWDAFLEKVVPDAKVRRFLQRAVGYSLTGDVTEHCLFFLYGKGRNGKTTFLEILRALLSEHAVQLPFDTLLRGAGNEQPRHLARLEGARVVIASEPSKGKVFDEAALKALTGGDRVSRRRLYQEADEFDPTHKFWLAGNHQPDVRDQTLALWERINCIPFDVTIKREERDKTLLAKLRNELPGILNWALAGCAQWQRGGLKIPEGVQSATDAYREETDVVGAFFDACATRSHTSWHSSSELYDAFCNWWVQENGAANRPWTSQTFFQYLKDRAGARKKQKKVNGVKTRGWSGYRLIKRS